MFDFLRDVMGMRSGAPLDGSKSTPRERVEREAAQLQAAVDAEAEERRERIARQDEPQPDPEPIEDVYEDAGRRHRMHFNPRHAHPGRPW